MSGWTKGEWELAGPDDFDSYTIKQQGAELAIAVVLNGAALDMPGDKAETRANARLIAASKKLYEALDEILLWHGDEIGDLDDARLTRAFAALTLARGDRT